MKLVKLSEPLPSGECWALVLTHDEALTIGIVTNSIGGSPSRRRGHFNTIRELYDDHNELKPALNELPNVELDFSNPAYQGIYFK